MSGLSKISGLPQMKLGWIVTNEPAAMDRLEWIADTYLSVSTPVQCALPRLLEAGESVQRQIRQRTAANLAYARGVLTGSSLEILQVEGGWYITLRMPRTKTEEEWAVELLARRDVFKVNAPSRDHFDPSNAGLAAWQAVYEQANDQVWVRKVVEMLPAAEGLAKLTDQLQIPDQAHGPAHVRIFVEGPQGHAVGIVNVAIKPAEKIEESANRAEPTGR